jgi:hypothetical protein
LLLNHIYLVFVFDKIYLTFSQQFPAFFHGDTFPAASAGIHQQANANKITVAKILLFKTLFIKLFEDKVR